MEADHDCEDLRRRFGLCPRCLASRAKPQGQLPVGLVPCAFACGEPVDPRERRTYRRMAGWTKSRAQGGTHALSLRLDLQQYAHSECIDACRAGRLDQPALEFPVDERAPAPRERSGA